MYDVINFSIKLVAFKSTVYDSSKYLSPKNSSTCSFLVFCWAISADVKPVFTWMHDVKRFPWNRLLELQIGFIFLFRNSNNKFMMQDFLQSKKGTIKYKWLVNSRKQIGKIIPQSLPENSCGWLSLRLKGM